MRDLPLSLSRASAHNRPMTKPSSDESMNVFRMLAKPSMTETPGIMIILMRVTDEIMQIGSDTTDSSIRRVRVPSILGTILSRPLRTPRTAMVLVPPIMVPRSIAWSSVKLEGMKVERENPTANVTLRMVATERNVAFLRLPMRSLMSALIPASKSMMLRAKVLIRGASSRNRALSKYPRTGPRIIPNARTQTMSGIFVFV
ncbi:hypothetical protein ES703_08577 [subsurface metagenome]